MSNRVEKAEQYFDEGCSCSQSVFSAFAPDYGLDKEEALKVASSFGGGMAHLGETCGVVTGALMVLGLRYGKPRAMTAEEKQVIDDKAREFIKEFNSRNGSIICKELLGYDVSIPEQRQECIALQLTNKECPKFVRDSAEILESLL
jgi:C_GCAxxG_C_C family probable redox protein